VNQGQLPPFGIECAAESPAQRRSHVALLQLTEQEPVQVMWQVEFPLQDTLPLAPTVAVHVELPVQSTLHESWHDPAQLVWFEQPSEQLPPSPPQVFAVNAQLVPELHVHDAPEQVGAGALVELPHDASMVATAIAKTMRMSHFRPAARWLSSASSRA
jgi:hypothetical protein